ncbi:HNH endonuclease [Brevibacterium sp. 239c]|uniref:HNH endonuclease n=1 Tax=Brevibacterium sp. 239c TaxID=1965356 RepID=UPI000C56C5C1|nr:HNH endonuclease [Brevibacterium sp. 239c]
MKTCSKCKIEKPLDEYPKNKPSKGGRLSYCKSCKSAVDKRYREANRGKTLGRHRQYYEANRERIREDSRRIRAANRDKIAAEKREYYRLNPQVKWQSKYRERANKYGIEAVIFPFTREHLIAKWGDSCHHCGGEWSGVDHYPVPVVHGGEHSLDNCVPSCMPCNQKSWRGGVSR